MNKYFLEEDFQILIQKINELEDELINIGKDIKVACEESSETWHDNFDYEEGKRKQNLVVGKLNTLLVLKREAVVVEKDEESLIGNRVKIVDVESCEEKEYQIGSYIVFDENKDLKQISYNSPIVKNIKEAIKNNVDTILIGGKKKKIVFLV
jgi:transcription elongation GreA/GreB family factor